MGKLIRIMFFSLLLTSCVERKETEERDTVGLSGVDVLIVKETNGCTYKYLKHYNGGVTTINLTKDFLEVVKLINGKTN